MSIEKYRVNPKTFSLKDIKTNDRSERSGGRESDAEELSRLSKEIFQLQDVLHAQTRHSILMIIQGMDASGKDGTVRHVFSGSDPFGIRVVSFKVPTREELLHDFLWRSHIHAPKAGELVIFNRSHYEDVLIVKVHGLIDEAECRRRYNQIRDYERILTENGTTIIKCFLHISKEEQKIRLQERLNDPTKTWKFNLQDLKERELWKDYMEAYERALINTSTDYAPWYVVPSDSRTNRNLLISRILLTALRGLKLNYPPVPSEYKNITIKD